MVNGRTERLADLPVVTMTSAQLGTSTIDVTSSDGASDGLSLIDQALISTELIASKFDIQDLNIASASADEYRLQVLSNFVTSLLA